jgi:hypothetical protein
MGRFADVDDVTSRFEGTIPSDREAWVDTRITDVEAVLTGLVPSLEESDLVIGEARLARVKTLVCNKVLDLYRNPEQATQRTQTAGAFSEGVSFNRSTGSGWFTKEELRSVRLRNRRANLGSTKLAPWRPERDPVLRHGYGYPDAGC